VLVVDALGPRTTREHLAWLRLPASLATGVANAGKRAALRPRECHRLVPFEVDCRAARERTQVETAAIRRKEEFGPRGAHAIRARRHKRLRRLPWTEVPVAKRQFHDLERDRLPVRAGVFLEYVLAD
jgi:hypothetical protein